MNWKSTASGYGTPALALHWLAVVLIAAAYATMELEDVFPEGSAGRDALAQWHYTIGLSVFALVWIRLLVRLADGSPEVKPPLPKWQAVLANWMHWALYGIMILVPLAGWAAASAQGTPLALFGYEIPALVSESERLADTLEDLHEAGATAGYFLIGLHAAAALFHHYVMRDNTLRLMLPKRNSHG